MCFPAPKLFRGLFFMVEPGSGKISQRPEKNTVILIPTDGCSAAWSAH